MAKSRPAQSVLCIFVAALLLLPSISTHAQQSISVKAVLEDASTAEPVGFATVSLTPEGKSAPSRYVLSTADGAVNLTKVAKGKYTLKVELMGYRTLEKKLEVTSSVDLGKLKIEQDVEVLEAASISAIGNPRISVQKSSLVKQSWVAIATCVSVLFLRRCR